MKNTYFLITVMLTMIFSGCKPKNTDWNTLYEAGKEEQKLYQTTLSEENFENALKIYKQVIDGSPELRNSALMQSSMMLSMAEQYDDAIRFAEQISDTAKVLQKYCNKKSVYIYVISANKALSNYDFDEHSSYSKKIADEMRPCLYERREAIYEAIQNAYEFDEDTQTVKLYNPDLEALFMYFMTLDPESLQKEVDDWKAGVPKSNEKTDSFFRFFSF